MKHLLVIGVTLTFLLGQPVACADDWVSNYYRSPAPDRFVDEVRALSHAGVLADKTKTSLMGLFWLRFLLTDTE